MSRVQVRVAVFVLLLLSGALQPCKGLGLQRLYDGGIGAVPTTLHLSYQRDVSCVDLASCAHDVCFTSWWHFSNTVHVRCVDLPQLHGLWVC